MTSEEFFGEKPEEGKTSAYAWNGVLILMVPDQTFVKGDETQGKFQRFFHLLLPQKRLIWHVFIVFLLITILGIVGSFYFYFKVLTDDILSATAV